MSGPILGPPFMEIPTSQTLHSPRPSVLPSPRLDPKKTIPGSPKVGKIMAFKTVLLGLGLFFYIPLVI